MGELDIPGRRGSARRAPRRSAKSAGLDEDAILAAAHDDALRSEAADGWRLAAERDGLFGVPTFIYAGRMYWGQDRMRFVRDAVLRKRAA